MAKLLRRYALESEVIVILCDEEQAEMLPQVPNHLCPQAVPRIEKRINGARFEPPSQGRNFAARPCRTERAAL